MNLSTLDLCNVAKKWVALKMKYTEYVYNFIQNCSKPEVKLHHAFTSN